MHGWIKLHRKVRDNEVLWSETYSKFEAFFDLVLDANHKDGRVRVGNTMVEVKRGQKLTSIKKLSERWGWSRFKTNSFLELLQSENMANIKKTSRYTLVTIVNYEVYQDSDDEKSIKPTSNQHQKSIKKTSKKHQTNTNKNDKECKEGEEKRIPTRRPTLIDGGKSFDGFKKDIGPSTDVQWYK